MEKGTAVKIVWGAYKGLEGEITKINGKNVYVMLSLGFEEFFCVDHMEEIQENTARKFAVGQAVKIDGTAFEVMGYDEVKGRYMVARLNPCNGKVRKGAKPVSYSESRIKGWNE